ncbi:hypothetical protein OROMI_010640 [Orobanche minor]
MGPMGNRPPQKALDLTFLSLRFRHCSHFSHPFVFFYSRPHRTEPQQTQFSLLPIFTSPVRFEEANTPFFVDLLFES